MIARLIEEYDLNCIDGEMAQCWTTEDETRLLYDLADYFNQELLADAIANSKM